MHVPQSLIGGWASGVQVDCTSVDDSSANAIHTKTTEKTGTRKIHRKGKDIPEIEGLMER